MLPSTRCRCSSRSSPCLALLLLALALLPLGCARAPGAPAGAEASPVPERISLGFGWPDGFSARVTSFESSRTISDAQEDEHRTELSYRLSLEPDPAGARIRYDDFALDDPNRDTLVRLRSVPGLEALAAVLRPSFVVSRDGRFGGTPGLEADVARINRELDALKARPGGPPPGAPLLPARFSAALFERHAPAEWWPLVELWAGREIEPGARYAVEALTRMPLLDGVSIRMDGELQVSGRMPCDSEDARPRCVELLLVSKPDPLALLPLLGGEAQRHDTGARSSPVTVTRLELDQTVRLLTEPEILVPHRVETRTRARLRLRLPDGSVHTDGLDQSLDLVFHPGS